MPAGKERIVRNLILHHASSTSGRRTLALRAVLALAVFLLIAGLAPRAHADTLPSPCVTTDYRCPIITNGPPELNYAHDQANITGQQLSGYGTVSVYSELIDSTGAIVNGSKQSLGITFSDYALLQIQPPSNATGRQLFAIYVERVNNGVTYDSTIMYVNRPTINKTSETTVRPGGVMYIWGRWLSQTDSSTANTSVFFRPPGGNGSNDIAASIVSGNTLQLEVNVPTGLTQGTAYSLVVTNGWGGTSAYGEAVFAKSTITAGLDAPDPLNLGVYWGANMYAIVTSANTYDITKDTRLPQRLVAGQKNDASSAIQADLNYIGNAGGGVLYFPTGTYVVDSELQILYPNLVLQGAGTGTVLTYGGTGSASTSGGFLAFAQNGVTLSGISQMTITNAFPGGSNAANANGALRIFSGKTNVSKLFLADVTFNLGQSYGMTLGNAVSDFVITRCNITQLRSTTNPSGYADDGPISAGTPVFTFTNNTVRYEIGRVHFTNTSHQWVMGNTISIDGTASNLINIAANSIESGGVEFSFSDDVAYIDNNISVSPAPDFATLSGMSGGPAAISYFYTCFELLLSQQSQYVASDFGTITATQTSGGVQTITDSSKSWGSIASAFPNLPKSRTLFIAITDGANIEQYANIASISGDTITLAAPFTVIPSAGAGNDYTISYFVNDTLVAQDNTISNGQVGIELYSGGINSSIRRNKIYGTQGIRLMGDDLQKCPNGCANGETYTRNLNWHADLISNKLDNEDSPAVGNLPEGLWLQTVQFENGTTYNQGLHGNTIFDVEIRSTAITAHNPVVPTPLFNDVDGNYTIGAWGSNGGGTDSNGSSYYPGALISLLGINFNGNTSTGAASSPPLVTTNGLTGFININNFQ